MSGARTFPRAGLEGEGPGDRCHRAGRPGDRRWVWLAPGDTPPAIGRRIRGWEVEAVVSEHHAVALRLAA